MRSLLRRREIRRILVIFTLVSGTPAAGASMALARNARHPAFRAPDPDLRCRRAVAGPSAGRSPARSASR